MSDFDRAKNLLVGAVDAVLTLASHESRAELRSSLTSTSQGPCTSQEAWSQANSSQISQRPAHSIEEHRRLFGYRPAKGKRRQKVSVGCVRRKENVTWKKECICLRDKEQTSKPSSEEKIVLAKMGLGLGEVVFNTDGDAEHIHRVLLSKFPMLEACGGYTLIRLAENSHRMVEIEGPESGMTVSFLKDILHSAKLYIRPLQRDITEEDMKEYSVPAVRNGRINHCACIV